MLKQIEIASHFRLPPMPPSYIVLTLFLVNTVFCFISPNPVIFRLFSFIYGGLMLYRIYFVQYFLKLAIIFNAFVIWSYFSQTTINKNEQKIIFWILFTVFSKILLSTSIGVLRALCFFKPIEFDDVYWVIQWGSIFEFLNYFTGVTWFRLIPSFLRIVQNLRVFDKGAIISAMRFVCIFIRQLLVTWSTEWIILSIIISFWEIYNNYINQFAMKRIFLHTGICIYNRNLILTGFMIITTCQWSWIWAGSYSGNFTIIRKVIWNFLRLESRLSDLYRKYSTVEIIQLHGSKDLHDIIY